MSNTFCSHNLRSKGKNKFIKDGTFVFTEDHQYYKCEFSLIQYSGLNHLIHAQLVYRDDILPHTKLVKAIHLNLPRIVQSPLLDTLCWFKLLRPETFNKESLVIQPLKPVEHLM